MTSLKALFGDIFPADVGDRPFAVRERMEFTPQVRDNYVFELDDIRLLLMWDSPRVSYNKNLLLTGPKGCGKSELVFQFAARTGREVLRYSCHERTEFADLLGGMSILADGSTAFQDGPLTLAMRRGAIFMLDEVNAARPGTLIGLNGVLDGAESVTLPSGEVVKRHAEFRVAVTGNSLVRDESAAAFRGTGAMNSAFLDRFFVIEKDYLPEHLESKLIITYLTQTLGDPMLNPQGIPVPVELPMSAVKFANSVREQFKKGQSEVSISTRGLLSFAEMIALRWPHVCGSPEDEVKFVASKTILGPVTGVMRATFMRLMATEMFDNKKWPDALLKQAGKGKATTAKGRRAALSGETHVEIFINPDRQNSGNVAIWGYLRGEATHRGFHGMLSGQPRITWQERKPASEILAKADEKTKNRGYILSMRLVLPGDQEQQLTSKTFTVGFPAAFSRPADPTDLAALGQAVERALVKTFGTNTLVLR